MLLRGEGAIEDDPRVRKEIATAAFIEALFQVSVP
jgi:hypothetical protein